MLGSKTIKEFDRLLIISLVLGIFTAAGSLAVENINGTPIEECLYKKKFTIHFVIVIALLRFLYASNSIPHRLQTIVRARIPQLFCFAV